MSSAFLELIGQGVLPFLTASALPLERLARDVWTSWGRDRDPASRRLDIETLAPLSAEAAARAADEAARRLLPGKADGEAPARAALTAFLAALPALARRNVPVSIDQADDLLRWLPPRLPSFLPGACPPGVGDRRLVEPVRITAACEVWLADNPRLPGRPAWLAFFPDPEQPPTAAIDWHTTAGAPPAALTLQHTFLGAPVPCLQFAAGPDRTLTDLLRHPGPEHATAFRQLVEQVAALHARPSPLALGGLQAADVLLPTEGAPTLLALPTGPATPRDDVRSLGRLGLALLGAETEPLAALLSECVADDPLLRPADATALLARLRPLMPAPPPSAPAPRERPAPALAPALAGAGSRARPRRGARLDQVLDWLQQAPSELPKLVTNSVGITFVFVPEGDFLMGSPPDEAGRRDNEGPVHEVHLPAFYLARHPVTQEQFLKVMGMNPSRFQGAAGGGLDHPVECVSWDDANTFCRRLGELTLEKEAGRTYRVPTEAEWERACRAGTSTPFHHGAALSARDAAIDGNHPYGGAPRVPSPPRTARVGSYPPNTFGLYDMHGNVWEWCSDWYGADYYAASPRRSPAGPEAGDYRVLRGGSWRNQASTCRAAYRNALAPNQRQPFIGFRVVLQLSPVGE